MELNCELTKQVVSALQAAGIKCYIVGGYVRDQLLGVESKDIDIELHNTTLEAAYQIVNAITSAKVVGNFGVISLTAVPTEFAIARTERKTSAKHTGFEIDFITNGDLKLAASRRDFTINSMMFDLQTNELIDNYHGAWDLEQRILRHVGPAFSEDPLRILRGIKFMARYNLQIDAETKQLCFALVNEVATLSTSRIQAEIEQIFQARYYQQVSPLLTELFANLLADEVTYCTQGSSSVAGKRLLFFKQFTNYQAAIDICYEQKLIKKDLKYCIDNFELFEQFPHLQASQKYNLLATSKDRLQYLTVINPQIEDYYQKYVELTRKYNGQYFISLGYQGKAIKTAMESQIGKELNEL